MRTALRPFPRLKISIFVALFAFLQAASAKSSETSQSLVIYPVRVALDQAMIEKHGLQASLSFAQEFVEQASNIFSKHFDIVFDVQGHVTWDSSKAKSPALFVELIAQVKPQSSNESQGFVFGFTTKPLRKEKEKK